MLPFASMLTRVSRARRRCSGSASAPTARAGGRVDQQRRVVAGRQAQLGPARAQPVQLRRRRHVAQRQRGQLGRVAPGGQQRPADPVGAGQHRLAQEVGAQLVAARRPPRRRRSRTNPARAATPPLIASEAKWSSSTTSARRRPGTRRHRVVGVGHHQEGEVGRAEVRRQPQPDLARPRPRTRCTTTTKPSVVIGSSSSGSRTVVQRGQHRRPVSVTRRCRHAAASTSCGVVLRGRRAGVRRRAGTRPAPRCRRAWPRSGPRIFFLAATPSRG